MAAGKAWSHENDPGWSICPFFPDYEAILKCDVLLCLLDGRVLDEGMCIEIEIGIAFALKKVCIGYKTDQRCQDKYGNNIMLDGTLSKVFNRKEDLLAHLQKIQIAKNSLVYSGYNFI